MVQYMVSHCMPRDSKAVNIPCWKSLDVRAFATRHEGIPFQDHQNPSNSFLINSLIPFHIFDRNSFKFLQISVLHAKEMTNANYHVLIQSEMIRLVTYLKEFQCYFNSRASLRGKMEYLLSFHQQFHQKGKIIFLSNSKIPFPSFFPFFLFSKGIPSCLDSRSHGNAYLQRIALTLDWMLGTAPWPSSIGASCVL